MSASPALVAEGISKSFRAVQALDDVSIELHYGRVKALLGDNGAGKSTLVKCISGVYQPDAGRIYLEGKEARINSSRDARDLGIETVHQSLAVIDPLDIAANLYLNRELTKGGKFGKRLGLLDKRKMKSQCVDTLNKLDIRIPSLARSVGSLSGGQRQAVAIGRAVAWNQRVVLLDEPAAALGVEQTQRVLDIIGNLRDQGVAVLLITHNMDRVFAVCDEATVLYQGKKRAEVSVADVSKDDLVSFITGARANL